MNIETESALSIGDLPPITVPMGIGGTLQGSNAETEEELRELGDKLFIWIRYISTVIDMSKLDGITAVADYEDVLAKFERGVEALKEKRNYPSDTSNLLLRPRLGGIPNRLACTRTRMRSCRGCK